MLKVAGKGMYAVFDIRRAFSLFAPYALNVQLRALKVGGRVISAKGVAAHRRGRISFRIVWRPCCMNIIDKSGSGGSKVAK